ncbi:hypothetical protein LR48_Vigan03g249400 [Vigna angularis]|uniref:Uncharacterized protein n=1 Tax=Phaseolus angularis TaxID=3914 RepID=A0A0L9U926_PHAAN|nr:hypothetical protein LR48_Vigan03g249400 [Vigna angularis]
MKCFERRTSPNLIPETFWRLLWGRAGISHYSHKEPVSGASKERQLNLSASHARPRLPDNSALSTRPLGLVRTTIRSPLSDHSASKILNQISVSYMAIRPCIWPFGLQYTPIRPLPYGHPSSSAINLWSFGFYYSTFDDLELRGIRYQTFSLGGLSLRHDRFQPSNQSS